MTNDDNDESLVLPPRDYSDIVKLGQENVLDQFLQHPTTAALEVITGAFANGRKGLLVSTGRIAQGLVKGQMYDALADEIRRLRKAGKLPDNLGETKHGLHTWAELCAIIDDECPDADRLEALKAMFYAVNKVGETDAERIKAHQLWQIAKQLKSGEIILLRTLRENSGQLDSIVPSQWLQVTAQRSGLGLEELVMLNGERLTDLMLCQRISDSAQQSARQSPPISSNRYLPTNMGHQFCQNIQTYKVDLEATKLK